MGEKFWTKELLYLKQRTAAALEEPEVIPVRPESILVVTLAAEILELPGTAWSMLAAREGDDHLLFSPFPVRHHGAIERMFPKETYIQVINRVNGFLYEELFVKPEAIQKMRDRKIYFNLPFREFEVYTSRAFEAAKKKWSFWRRTRHGGSIGFKNNEKDDIFR